MTCFLISRFWGANWRSPNVRCHQWNCHETHDNSFVIILKSRLTLQVILPTCASLVTPSLIDYSRCTRPLSTTAPIRNITHWVNLISTMNLPLLVRCPHSVKAKVSSKSSCTMIFPFGLIKVKLATIVEGNPKAPFSIATTPMCRGGRYSFPGLLYFTLDPYLIMLSAKQGGIKYHFLSLWYDSTWDWTQVSRAIGEHSNP